MEKIWWERVPDALAFAAGISESLLEEKSVIIQSQGDIPWRGYMVYVIKEAVKQKNSSKRFESIEGVDDPGAYLLRKFCKPEKRAMYRPSKTYARFLAENDDIVLHSRYLWVTANSRENLEMWADFVSAYIKERGSGKEMAAFILEYAGAECIDARRGVRQYVFEDYISEYDRIVFATLASSTVKEEPFIKRYLAELASDVVENDIELCAECLKRAQEFLRDPQALTSQITHNGRRSDGRPFSFSKSREEISRAIWLAQIKTVYPVLEEYREAFVEKYAADIQAQLPIKSTYGEVFADPKEVELGTLFYMAGQRKLNISSQEYERLKRYREARNVLSHLNVLRFEDVRELII